MTILGPSNFGWWVSNSKPMLLRVGEVDLGQRLKLEASARVKRNQSGVSVFGSLRCFRFRLTLCD